MSLAAQSLSPMHVQLPSLGLLDFQLAAQQHFSSHPWDLQECQFVDDAAEVEVPWPCPPGLQRQLSTAWKLPEPAPEMEAEQWETSTAASSSRRSSLSSNVGITPRPQRATKAMQAVPVTTFMVQNLSKNTTRHRFLEALNSLGFEGCYDFVHVPTSFQTGRNQGFAFVNFVDEAQAARFAGLFQASDGTKPTDKLWRVAPALKQGFKANADAAKKGKMSRVRSNAHRPLFMPQQ